MRLPPSSVSTNIGLVEFFISSYIYPEIIRGCYNALSRNGFDLLLNQSEYNLEQEKGILLDLRKKKVGGHHHRPDLRSGGRSNALLLEEIQNEGTAVVLCDDYFPGKELQQRHSRLSDLRRGGRRRTSGRRGTARSASSIRRISWSRRTG